LTELQRFVFSAYTQRDVLCKITVYSLRILLGRFSKGRWEGQEDKKGNIVTVHTENKGDFQPVYRVRSCIGC